MATNPFCIVYYDGIFKFAEFRILNTLKKIDFNAGWSTIGRYRTSKKSNKASIITNASSVGKSNFGI
jgi:hypothetical protein